MQFVGGMEMEVTESVVQISEFVFHPQYHNVPLNLWVDGWMDGLSETKRIT